MLIGDQGADAGDQLPEVIRSGGKPLPLQGQRNVILDLADFGVLLGLAVAFRVRRSPGSRALQWEHFGRECRTQSSKCAAAHRHFELES